MSRKWDEIYKRVFPWKTQGWDNRTDLSADEAARVDELELVWRQAPARTLRKMSSSEGHVSFIEDTSVDNETVLDLAERFDIRTMFSQPTWVKTQMYVYIVVLNMVFEFVHHDLQVADASSAVMTQEDRDALELFHSDMERFMDVMAESGGIELIRHKPFPMAGPGAQPEDIDTLMTAYLESHAEFVSLRCSAIARRCWHRLRWVLGTYKQVLKTFKPSPYLALTSASIETRWLSCYRRNNRPDEELMEEIDMRVKIPRRFVDDEAVWEEYTDNMRERFEDMNSDLLQKNLSGFKEITWDLIEDAIEDAGLGNRPSFDLPEGYKPVYEDGLAKQVIRHGGCPQSGLSGCDEGALTGSGWVSLPSILQDVLDIWFWDIDGTWLWIEDGTGRIQPQPRLQDMARLSAEIGPIKVLDKDGNEVQPSEVGASEFSTASEASVPESGASY